MFWSPVLELVAVVVRAAHNHDFLRAAGDDQLPLVDKAQITRIHPAIFQHAFGVGRRVAVIARHDALRAHLEMPNLPQMVLHTLVRIVVCKFQ